MNKDMDVHRKSKMEFSSEDRSVRKKRKVKKRKKKNYSSSSDSSSSDSGERRAKKRRREKRKKSKKDKKEKQKNEILIGPLPPQNLVPSCEDQVKKVLAPMSKSDWEKKQSTIRRVFDEESGRHRLIRGDGEILEEIVSRDRHLQINKQATQGDGEYFQAVLSKKI